MEFMENPGILENMRFCLGAMAQMKNIKLEYPLEEYDMETMLKMMTEMEDIPIYRSPKQCLKDAADKVIWYFAHSVLWVIRGLVFIIALVCRGEEVQAAAKKFRNQHGKARKEKYNA